MALTLAPVAASAADIVETAVAGHFNTLVAAIKAAGLVETLKGPGPFTVFAPTDEAFAKLPPARWKPCSSRRTRPSCRAFSRITWYAGKVIAQDVVKLHSAKTVEGQTITIKTMNGGVMVNNAHVIKTDIAASNGVIHVIDAVILPK